MDTLANSLINTLQGVKNKLLYFITRNSLVYFLHPVIQKTNPWYFPDVIRKVRVTFSYDAANPDELTLAQGEIVEVLADVSKFNISWTVTVN